ncbi:MAG TPA: four helix bundle protein [Pyrinomonadaceae bacterium]
MAAETFQDVELGKKAHAWVLGVYRFTDAFPKQELFGLTSRLRRAAAP